MVSFGIGGPADLFYRLNDIEKFRPIIEKAVELKIPYFVLGGGSNTIFADVGFRGLIIHLEARNITLESTGSETYVVAESGALLSQVVQFSLKNNFTGIEKMMGLPGTIGGAVRGNAGAFGLEMRDIVVKALVYSQDAGSFEVSNQMLAFDYRMSAIKASQGKDHSFPGIIVLKVWLKLQSSTREEVKTALHEATDIVKNRISKQPKGKCSGSFFKNPVTPDYNNQQDPSTKAGYLLEQIGAKGMQIGGVQVSKEHANWLMNTGNGTQKDVLELSVQLQKKVKERFNIQLEREVQLVSEDGLFL